MRMDKYDDEKKENQQDEMPILSREKKNQDMYEELYLNNRVVDFNNIMNEEKEEEKTVEEQEDYVEETYEEKNYSIDDYLKKAHEKLVDDNAMRNLNNQEFRDQEDEIVRLIASIDEKDDEDDLFKDLRGDNEDTMIGGSLKTDEFDTLIYETLAEDKKLDYDEAILDKAISDNTMFNLEKENDAKLEHTFEKIIESDHKMAKKSKNLPIIVFSITLFMLVMVIVIILLFK